MDKTVIKKLLIVGLVFVCILVVAGATGVGGYFIGKFQFENKSVITVQVPSITTIATNSATVVSTVVATPSSTTTIPVQNPVHPSYELSVGSGKIVVPEGWYVSNVVSNDSHLTEEEIKRFSISGHYENFPIFREADLILSNGVSNIVIHSPKVLYPVDSAPDCLPDTYKLVKQPTDNNRGLARIQSESKYSYVQTFVYDPDTCMVGYTYDPELSFTFEGNEVDLPVADKMFGDYFLEDYSAVGQFSFGN